MRFQHSESLPSDMTLHSGAGVISKFDDLLVEELCATFHVSLQGFILTAFGIVCTIWWVERGGVC
jgi:hypothetical protein